MICTLQPSLGQSRWWRKHLSMAWMLPGLRMQTSPSIPTLWVSPCLCLPSISKVLELKE